MTVYHIDLAQSYEATWANDGLSSASPWGAISGANRAVSLAVAGDEILLANAPDPANNRPIEDAWLVTVAGAAGFDVGDAVTVGATQVGRVAVVVSSTQVLMEIANGGFMVGATISPDGGGTTTTVSAVELCGLRIFEDMAASGGTAGPITLRGVASDWTTPQRAYLDAANMSAAVHIGDVAGWTLSMLDIDRPGQYGVWVRATGGQTGWVLDRVRVTNAGDRAFYNVYRFYYGLMSRCESIGAAQRAIYTSPYAGRVEHCVFAGSGDAGVYAPGNYTTFDGCLIVDNGGDGVYGAGHGDTFVGCTIDGNAGDGISITLADRTSVRILRNRITHNGGYGVNAAGQAAGSRSDRNVFFANALGAVAGWTGGPNDRGPAGSGLAHEDVTADGYVDRAGGNYALAPGAAGRRVAVEVNDINGDFIAAGLNGDDLSAPDEADVRAGVVYADGSRTGTLAVRAACNHQVSFLQHEVTFP